MEVVRGDHTTFGQLNIHALGKITRVAEQWCRGDGVGLQVAIYRDAQLVLSAWGGVNQFSRCPIERTTLFPVLSAAKGIASVVLLHLHHLGYFRWADRIAQYWPEFGRGNKSSATFDDLLSHRLGLPELTASWRKWPDRRYMTELVEHAEAKWPPGTRYGYHGGSWGNNRGRIGASMDVPDDRRDTTEPFGGCGWSWQLLPWLALR